MRFFSEHKYECNCGNTGSYTTTSTYGFFTNLLFGNKSGPLKCLRCEATICYNCKNGKYCQSCHNDRPKELSVLYDVLGFFLFFSVFSVIIIIGMALEGVDMLEIIKISLIIIGIFIGLRIGRFYIKTFLKLYDFFKVKHL